MLFQLEYAAVVETDALENSVPIQKAVIEHRNFRVCFRKEFAIDVNRERLRGPLRRARLVRRFYRSRLPLPRLVFYQCCASTAVCRFCKHKKISAVKQSIQAAFRPPPKTKRYTAKPDKPERFRVPGAVACVVPSASNPLRQRTLQQITLTIEHASTGSHVANRHL